MRKLKKMMNFMTWQRMLGKIRWWEYGGGNMVIAGAAADFARAKRDGKK